MSKFEQNKYLYLNVTPSNSHDIEELEKHYFNIREGVTMELDTEWKGKVISFRYQHFSHENMNLAVYIDEQEVLYMCGKVAIDYPFLYQVPLGGDKLQVCCKDE